MKQIVRDSGDELVIAIRSTLIACVGGLGILFLLYLAYLLITPGHSGDERIIGLLGASATCALAFLVFYERADLSFDRKSRTLKWLRQRGFSIRNGMVPLASIERVVLQSCMGSNKHYPRHRVVLITENRELPIMLAYEHDDMNEVIAERIRSFLALSSNTLLEDSVSSLVENGRNLDAIRLLREKSGMSLPEAHSIVAKIKDGIRPNPRAGGSETPPRDP